jgi:hypothetical protein
MADQIQQDIQKDMLSLTDSEFDMVTEALENFKSKGLTGDLIGALFEGMIGDKLSEKEKAQREVKKAEEKAVKEREEKVFKRKVDFLKAKLFIMKERNIL